MCSTLHAFEKKGLLPMEAELGKSTQREYQYRRTTRFSRVGPRSSTAYRASPGTCAQTQVLARAERSACPPEADGVLDPVHGTPYGSHSSLNTG